MAKVSKLNIAITGDSKGFTRATEQAAKSMKKLTTDASNTKVTFGQMKGTFNQTAEALGKFGVQSRALQMLGGAAGIASMGPMGMAMAGAALTVQAASTSIGKAVDMVEGIPNQRKNALEAIKQNKRDDRVGFEKVGLTRALAEGIASRPAPAATTGMSMAAGMQTGYASQNTAQSRLLNMLVNELPGALGVSIGARVGGASREDAATLGIGAMFGDDATTRAKNISDRRNDVLELWNGMKGWASF